MPQNLHGYIEEGDDAVDHDGPDNQPRPELVNQPPQPPQGESNFADSSGPLFSMYNKIAEEEDNKMTDRWQKDADALLIFTGLFSAAVAALLAVSIQDLRPNSQDTSAFYLESIYLLLADSNGSRASAPAVSRPPPFSPPRYAVWVNSLWFLSLVISLTGALLATSLHQWARRYIRITQPARSSPEKRARMRAFFADGVDKLRVPQAVEALPVLLHLSLVLFFCGLIVFLFNIEHAVFGSVTLWIAVFFMVYGCITVLPVFRHDSPYSTPLSRTAWFLYTSLSYLILKFLAFISPRSVINFETRRRFRILRDLYRVSILGGVEEAAEKTASNRSSQIDIRVLDWTISALGEDDTLEQFFDAIPGFFNSKIVRGLEEHFSFDLYTSFWWALDRFSRRTLSSNSVMELAKSRRIDVCMNVIKVIFSPNRTSFPVIRFISNFYDRSNQVTPSIEIGHALARWCDDNDERIALGARAGVSSILASVAEHDDRWVALAVRHLELPEWLLQDYIAHGQDSVSLAILIHFVRQIRSDNRIWLGDTSLLSQLDILNTLPGLQHEFCALWNQIVREAAREEAGSDPVKIVKELRRLYIPLHQGTCAAPTAFSASTRGVEKVLEYPSSYPLCNIADHCTQSVTQSHHSTSVSASALPPTNSPDAPNAPTVFDTQSTTGRIAGPGEPEEPNVIPGHPSPDGPSPTSGLQAQNITPLDYLRLHVRTSEVAVSSRAPPDSPLVLLQPGVILPNTTPPTGPPLPSVSVANSGEASDGLQFINLGLNVASYSAVQQQQERTTSWAAPDVDGTVG